MDLVFLSQQSHPPVSLDLQNIHINVIITDSLGQVTRVSPPWKISPFIVPLVIVSIVHQVIMVPSNVMILTAIWNYMYTCAFLWVRIMNAVYLSLSPNIRSVMLHLLSHMHLLYRCHQGIVKVVWGRTLVYKTHYWWGQWGLMICCTLCFLWQRRRVSVDTDW